MSREAGSLKEKSLGGYVSNCQTELVSKTFQVKLLKFIELAH